MPLCYMELVSGLEVFGRGSGFGERVWIRRVVGVLKRRGCNHILGYAGKKDVETHG